MFIHSQVTHKLAEGDGQHSTKTPSHTSVPWYIFNISVIISLHGIIYYLEIEILSAFGSR